MSCLMRCSVLLPRMCHDPAPGFDTDFLLYISLLAPKPSKNGERVMSVTRWHSCVCVGRSVDRSMPAQSPIKNGTRVMSVEFARVCVCACVGRCYPGLVLV